MMCPNCSVSNLPGSDQCRNCGQDLTPHDRPVAQDRVERSLMEDPVRVLCPDRAPTLTPTATVAEALSLMTDRDIGALLVVEEGKLVGIFSERDLLIRVAGHDRAAMSQPIRNFMTAHPETVRETDSLAFALHKMDGGGYRHLPVLKDGQPWGMISVRDMLRHITQLCRDY